MNQIDRQALYKLAEDEQITNMAMVTYLSAVAIAKYNEELCCPEITRFTVYGLYKAMSDKMNWINKSSVELAVKDLVDMGYFEIRCGLLTINHTGLGHIHDDFFKGDGYVNLRLFLFKEVFFKLPLRCKKLVLLLMARVGNDKDKSVKFNFKSKKDSDTFAYYCRILKVNRLAHIKQAVRTLSKLFYTKELAHNTFEFKFNEVGELLLKAEKSFFKFTQKQLDKVKSLFDRFNGQGFLFRKDQLEAVTDVVKNCGWELREKVVKELCKADRNDPGNQVENMYGYAKSLLVRLSVE